MVTINVKTSTRAEMIDVTSLIRSAVRDLRVGSGIATVFCPHTTAAVTIQENSDPAVKGDMVSQLQTLVPRDSGSKRPGDNSDAHTKGSLIGASLSIIVDGGRLVLGPWQAIFFCEFDGPRSRQVHVKVVSD